MLKKCLSLPILWQVSRKGVSVHPVMLVPAMGILGGRHMPGFLQDDIDGTSHAWDLTLQFGVLGDKDVA
ncbi:hypothetical protein GCM10010981_37350 [Dyella nitratireducens]|uniref:Uncharacterized protein n=1 Tax=Dyella nitratireducens TaxID=1849580 RepID=A0ABQ1GJ05_9GAMM|nr:hypothetical protein GCM10010981_37350 [Dyella nitratireducens]GLQ41237.1 hypothetical protein GCM10007902_10870 [Dyella nitratireducens]